MLKSTDFFNIHFKLLFLRSTSKFINLHKLVNCLVIYLFTSKKVIYKLKIIFVALIFCLSSCNINNKNSFYYSEGKIIQDTNQLKVLNEELRTILKGSDQPSKLKIYTSLSYEKKVTFEKVLKKYNLDYLRSLKKEFSSENKTLDSLNQNRKLIHVSIIAINNQTGEIENYTTDHSHINQLKDNDLGFKAIRLYGYILTFNKGKSLSDTFIQSYNWNNKPSYTSIFNSFNYTFPDIRNVYYPFTYYSKKEWINLSKSLNINLDLSKFKIKNGTPEVKTSLFDLTKTASIIQKNGKLREPKFIRKIIKNGNVIFKNRNYQKQVIEIKSAKKIKTLLSKSMLKGWNVMHYRKYNILEDCFIYNGGLVNNRWKIYSSDKYTIGLMETYLTYIKSKNGKTILFHHNINIEKYYNLLLSKILNGMNLNLIKGKNYNSDRKKFHDDLYKNYGL